MAKIKVVYSNNSDARRLLGLGGLAAKHNGGKVVYVTCRDADSETVATRIKGVQGVVSIEMA